jgi:hypothetical protein
LPQAAAAMPTATASPLARTVEARPAPPRQPIPHLCRCSVATLTKPPRVQSTLVYRHRRAIKLPGRRCTSHDPIGNRESAHIRGSGRTPARCTWRPGKPRYDAAVRQPIRAPVGHRAGADRWAGIPVDEAMIRNWGCSDSVRRYRQSSSASRRRCHPEGDASSSRATAIRRPGG